MVRALLLALVLATPSVAIAETSVLLPIAGEPSLVAAHEDEIVERVWQAFDGHGALLAREELDRAIADAHAEACAETRCAPALLEALEADHAVSITLASASEGVRVVVVVVDAHGVERSGEATGAADAVSETVATALAAVPAETEASGEPPPTAHPAATGPDFGVIGSGSVLGAVGLGLFAVGLVNALDTEHCVSGCEPTATERSVHVPATDVGIGLAVVGGLAVAGGIVLVVVGALARVPRAQASLDARGLTVHF